MFDINGGFLPVDFRRRKALTLNLEYNVDSPNAGCDGYDNLVLVPNGDTGSARECLIQGKTIESGKLDIHAEHDQERREDNG